MRANPRSDEISDSVESLNGVNKPNDKSSGTVSQQD